MKTLPRMIAFLCLFFLFSSSTSVVLSEEVPYGEPTQDVYYHTQGIPQGLAAEDIESVYPQWRLLDNRIVTWMVTQQHTYFGGFVLALPLFALLLEFIARSRRDPDAAKHFDDLARDILRVGVLSMSVTALLGSVMLVGFVTFYPGFMNYMGSTFKDLMPAYAMVFLGESSLLLLYYYSWDRMTQGGRKWVHMSIGVLANAMGLLLLPRQ